MNDFKNPIGVFIDTSNLYYCCRRTFNANISYAQLIGYIQDKVPTGDLIIRAYGTYIGDKPLTFIHNLVQLGVMVSYKEAREVERGKFKADCDIDIAIEIIKHLNNFDTFVLCSADGDFLPLIKYLLDANKKVFVFGVNVSNELRTVVPCFEITERELEHAIAKAV